MKIIHAVCDENGKARGGQLGDQTGKEIREQNWYDRPWSQYIECTDRALAEHAVTIAKAICKGDYGYSQDARWTGYDAICKHGIENGRGDFDCSSLVLSCYVLTGLNIREKKGSTHDLAEILSATGKFKVYCDSEHLKNPNLAKIGSMFCTPGAHVCICIEDGKACMSDEEPSRELIRAKGSIRVRETPQTGKTLAIAHKGDVIEVYGSDPETGWYMTSTGYVTNNSRYVEKC